jgi:hypothetical protein
MVTGLAGTALAETPTDSDACRAAIPVELLAPIAKRFPDFRLPKLSDLSDHNIATSRRSGRNGCAVADRVGMVGKDMPAIAVILVGNGHPAVRLVAAVHRTGGWAIYSLPTWCESIADCYVEGREGGTYERTAALSGPITEPDEKETITAQYGVIVSGTLSSTGVAYVLDHDHWDYVWIVD